MERAAYDAMARTQSVHWWFVARRRVLEGVISRLRLPASPRILEVGCGPGGNLEMLQRHGSVKAVEYDSEACRMARQVAPAVCIEQGALPDQLPFPEERFDLLCMFDVLEHIGEDVASLQALRSRVQPDGMLLLTVPAYQWLFSAHDAKHHHHRRYTVSRLRQVAEASGWTVERCGYFNTLLFPLAAIKRAFGKLIPALDTADDGELPLPLINRVLEGAFAVERHLVPRKFLWFGLSAIAVLRAPQPLPQKQTGHIPNS